MSVTPMGQIQIWTKGLVPVKWKQSPSRCWKQFVLKHVVKVGLAQRHVPQAEGSEQPRAFGPAPFAESFVQKNNSTFVSSGFPWEMRPPASTDEADGDVGTTAIPQQHVAEILQAVSAQALDYKAEQHPWRTRCQDGSSVTWQGWLVASSLWEERVPQD